MSELPATFRAFVAEQRDDDVERGLQELSFEELLEGDVTIKVAWSSVNYKDGLATIPKGNVAQISPLVPGIDLAGEVVASETSEVEAGDEVLVHGYDIGVAHHGGYAEYARVPADWVVPLPSGLDLRSAMAIGTAGFTAGLSVQLLEQRGLEAGGGPILVTGASGGVGSTAVSMLASLGFEVVASSGKQDAHDWLRELGASEVIGRDEAAGSGKPLDKQRYAGAVDCVGGEPLAAVLAQIRVGGAVAASGNAAGFKLPTTVFPFILRGVALLGVDSVHHRIDRRRALWSRLADDLKPAQLTDSMTTEVELDNVEEALDRVLAGDSRGRTVVRIAD
ncbi:MAG: oxidoreductase [Egibacteraceae bacterium]